MGSVDSLIAAALHLPERHDRQGGEERRGRAGRAALRDRVILVTLAAVSGDRPPERVDINVRPASRSIIGLSPVAPTGVDRLALWRAEVDAAGITHYREDRPS